MKTQKELDALSDAELNALAATLVMGWTKREESYQIFDVESGILRDWVDSDGKCQSAVCDWWPALDRVQSGKLLQAMVKRGAEFSVWISNNEPHVSCRTAHRERFSVPGNSPRSETIAAILAAQLLTANVA